MPHDYTELHFGPITVRVSLKSNRNQEPITVRGPLIYKGVYHIPLLEANNLPLCAPVKFYALPIAYFCVNVVSTADTA
jgi:hypothetical protein